MRLVDERLDLHQHRPRAFLRHHDTRAGNFGSVLRQKERRRVRNTFESLVGHREYAQLVHGPVAILERTNQTEARMRITLEVETVIDHMFEHPWSGKRAFLRHVSDENDRSRTGFGYARELS